MVMVGIICIKGVKRALRPFLASSSRLLSRLLNKNSFFPANMGTLTTLLVSNTAPKSPQDSGKVISLSLQNTGKAISLQNNDIEAMSPQDFDAFDYVDFVDSDDEGLLEEYTEPE